MAALNRALAFSQTDDVAVLVAQHLEFDGAWMLDMLFEIEIAITECGRGLGLRLAIECGQFLFIAHNTHPASAATGRGFEDDGKFDLSRPLQRFFFLGGATPPPGGRERDELTYRLF